VRNPLPAVVNVLLFIICCNNKETSPLLAACPVSSHVVRRYVGVCVCVVLEGPLNIYLHLPLIFFFGICLPFSVKE